MLKREPLKVEVYEDGDGASYRVRYTDGSEETGEAGSVSSEVAIQIASEYGMPARESACSSSECGVVTLYRSPPICYCPDCGSTDVEVEVKGWWAPNSSLVVFEKSLSLCLGPDSTHCNHCGNRDGLYGGGDLYLGSLTVNDRRNDART